MTNTNTDPCQLAHSHRLTDDERAETEKFLEAALAKREAAKRTITKPAKPEKQPYIPTVADKKLALRLADEFEAARSMARPAKTSVCEAASEGQQRALTPADQYAKDHFDRFPPQHQYEWLMEECRKTGFRYNVLSAAFVNEMKGRRTNNNNQEKEKKNFRETAKQDSPS